MSVSLGMPVKIMSETKFYTPMKIGLLVVSIAYFLFTLHAVFTLSWIGEWEYLGSGSASFWIFITDVSAYFGLVFRCNRVKCDVVDNNWNTLFGVVNGNSNCALQTGFQVEVEQPAE
jgi:hypothetical protein